MSASPVKLVAVVPARAQAARGRLFDVLEEAFPVRFEGREADSLAGADGAIFLEAHARAAEPGLPCLVAIESESTNVGPGNGSEQAEFELTADVALDRRLRGVRLVDGAAGSAEPLRPVAGEAVLAARDGAPLWTSRGSGPNRCDVAALAPAELGHEEALRERLQEGRSLALLPLVHFLRELTAEIDFTPPPPRASFLIDDPNLHWTSYGHLRYPEIARHADEHGYHAAMAMVPRDGWVAHPKAARLFRERADRLSLVFHGNDHVLQELARPLAPLARRALLAQALRRVERFERRSGLRVARVMTAPHGDCSEGIARDTLLLGFEALCIGRPYPWAARPPHSWLARPERTSALAGFEPTTLVAGGLPVMLRRPFEYSTGDLALRAFLNQPLIVYGHHTDLENGLERFADWAERVRSVGGARWCSFGEIAATAYAIRREGELLRVRLHGRRASLALPDGVTRLRLELPAGHDGLPERVVCSDGASAPLGGDLELRGSEPRVEVALRRADAIAADAVPPPPWRPGPLARRIAGEGRDRLAPLYRRASLTLAQRGSVRLPTASKARASSR